MTLPYDEGEFDPASPSYLVLFLRALKNPHSYNPLSNEFFWYGFCWGLPIPVVTLWLQYRFRPLSLPDLIADEPIQIFFLLHPVLFGILFGVMGSMIRHYVKRLRKESIRDGLTGLYNHRYFRRALRRRTTEAERYDLTFSLVMLDIDRFKTVNDEFGHQAGDEVLIDLARLLTVTTRKSDVVCRYGGEEFAIILPETSLNEAYELAERLRDRIGNHDFEVGKQGLQLSITVSGGVASYPGDATSETGLIKIADERLYNAKESGRDTVCRE